MSWRDEGDQALPPPRPSEPKNLRADILDELADHLVLATKREGECEQGEPSNETIWARVLKQFGDPDAIARRLWWDAMRETVMREWVQTLAIIAGPVAVLLFVALGFRQMQATNLALLEALERQSGDAAGAFSTLDLTIRRGTADGPPASNIKVSTTGKWFGEDTITVDEVPNDNGHLFLGPIRQGQYKLVLLDPNSGLMLERSLTLFGGRKKIFIVAPFAETTKVNFDLGLPEFSDDNHQLVRSTLEFEWSEGGSHWTSSVDIVIGHEGMWELSRPDRSRAAGRAVVPRAHQIDRLGRSVLSYDRGPTSRRNRGATTHNDRGELLDLRLPHHTRLQVTSLNGTIATPQGHTKLFHEAIRPDSNEFLAKLTAPLDVETQEFVISEGSNQQIAVALPQPFLDAFTRETRIWRNTVGIPDEALASAIGMDLDFETDVFVEAHEVPLIGVGTPGQDGRWPRVNTTHERFRLSPDELEKGVYVPIPDALNLRAHPASTRCILAIKGEWEKDSTTVAFAVKSPWEFEAPETGSAVSVEQNPFWRRADRNDGKRRKSPRGRNETWLRIDITDLVRSASSANPLHGVLIRNAGERLILYNGSSDQEDEAGRARPRLLVFNMPDYAQEETETPEAMRKAYEKAANAPRVLPILGESERGPPLYAQETVRISLVGSEIEKRLLDAYSDIAKKVDIREAKDKDGRVIGLTSANLSEIEVLTELGLQDNDILRTINGKGVDTAEEILNVLKSYPGARFFRVGIIRDGKPLKLEYNLQR
jgi:hypothetical protein